MGAGRQQTCGGKPVRAVGTRLAEGIRGPTQRGRAAAATRTHLEAEAALLHGGFIGAGPLQPALDGLEDELLPGEERDAEKWLHRGGFLCVREGAGRRGATGGGEPEKGGGRRSGAQLAPRGSGVGWSGRAAQGVRVRAGVSSRSPSRAEAPAGAPGGRMHSCGHSTAVWARAEAPRSEESATRRSSPTRRPLGPTALAIRRWGTHPSNRKV